ncbi:hypothetical protein ALC62_06671 [Cyphomyrmex costatus]|uniref:Uncharacterized protein n=1 Tax=Cyphomyrmex costatus TaxID=456900 RepID=A0A151IIP2_9HYME|nr:hypothetical protein ALC62_06671 [Cyphomyrmex costatus]
MNEVTDETSEKASGGDGRFATFRSVAYVPLLSPLANRDSRKTSVSETAPPWTGTESARLAPKRIASRPASTDMQDSGVDGPHTTGMHRTSYKLHTPSPGAPGPLAPARASSFTFLSPLPSQALSLSLSLSLSLFLAHSLSQFSAVIPLFFSRPSSRPLTSYHSERVNGFGRPLGLPSANLVSLLRVFDRVLAPIDRRVGRRPRETYAKVSKWTITLVTSSSIIVPVCR